MSTLYLFTYIILHVFIFLSNVFLRWFRLHTYIQVTQIKINFKIIESVNSFTESINFNENKKKSFIYLLAIAETSLTSIPSMHFALAIL